MGKSTSNDPGRVVSFFPENRKILLNEIRGKWSKFSEQDLAALNDKDDLVTQVGLKYSVAKARAERDVYALLKGRKF